MAVHKHLTIILKQRLFSYNIITSFAFDYIEKKMRKEGVMDLLCER
jgi:hypothetical protein